jgi:hypothetical protein
MRLYVKAAIIATAAVATASGIFLPVFASAGSAGQQISICGDKMGGTAKITGTNQDGAQVTTESTFNPIGCRTVHNYWWVGQVTIDYTSDTGGTGSEKCEVAQDNGAPPDSLASIVECRLG